MNISIPSGTFPGCLCWHFWHGDGRLSGFSSAAAAQLKGSCNRSFTSPEETAAVEGGRAAARIVETGDRKTLYCRRGSNRDFAGWVRRTLQEHHEFESGPSVPRVANSARLRPE